METLNVGKLRQLVQESSNEFKAKLGNGVESGNKAINDKAYKDADNISKDHYGKEMKEPKKAEYEKVDGNKTMLDIQPDFEPGDNYKERVKKQVEGYTSADEAKNGIEKAGVEFNDDFYKATKKTGEKMVKNKENDRHKGIWGGNMSKDSLPKINTIYKESRVKTVRFKKTEFLTEGHMISKIPDEFKNEGQTFIMEDKTGNRYTIEWSDNRANIIGHENKQGLNETLDRMKSLMGYKSADYFRSSTPAQRLNESGDGFVNTLNNARKTDK